MWISSDWKDYELLDCGGGERLERWGKYLLVRPDPQAIWRPEGRHPGWRRHDARYQRASTGGGQWVKKELPQRWTLGYKGLTLNIKPMNFKHTGVFPEQAANWDFAMERIRSAGRPIRVLNLFAYTGAASVACAAAGAAVCHVDAAKGMVAWARENAALSGLENRPIRWIVDDCLKFIRREIRRGNRYDGIIMDPPSYGRGPGGEVWQLEEQVYTLVEEAAKLLYEDSLFFLLNSYTTGLSASVMEYILGVVIRDRIGGQVSSDEIGLPVKSTGYVLPCGSTAIWQR